MGHLVLDLNNGAILCSIIATYEFLEFTHDIVSIPGVRDNNVSAPPTKQIYFYVHINYRWGMNDLVINITFKNNFLLLWENFSDDLLKLN